MRCRERLHHREDEWRRVVLEVHRERARHALGALAADERAVGPGAAEVPDQLDAAGDGVLLDAKVVAQGHVARAGAWTSVAGPVRAAECNGRAVDRATRRAHWSLSVTGALLDADMPA